MKATFANKDNALWPGLSVTTRLLVNTLKPAVVIPNDAIQRGPNGLYAFVVGEDNKVAMQTIKISEQGTDQSVVQDGVSPGQKVVVAGQYRLQPGALVRPNERGAAAASTGEGPQNTPAKAP
jgi:multidrug efflux system membrane fusion protein